jgi:MFS transporter, PPP family, 3-phenylpropionic acid transporter
MTKAEINTFRIDANYAAVQGSYCAGMCALNAFTAVYLIFKGFTNTQTGVTVSLLSLSAIFVQIFVSNFADSHTNIQLKKIVLVLYLITVAGCTTLWLLPLPVAFLIIAYCIAGASQRSIMGLINAMMLQFSNLGLRVNYGWPRGVCSILFALSAFVLGILIEKYSPNIIMPISIGLTIFGIISVIVMPNPDQISRHNLTQSTVQAEPVNGEPSTNEKVSKRPTSYLEMIRSNPTLIMFIVASILLSLGQSTASVFMIRIIEAAGGSVQDLGTAILIQAGIEFPMLFASVWVLKKFKVSNILVFSFFCYAIKQFGFVIAPSVGGIYGVMTISLFCMGIYAFASVFFVHSIVHPSEMVRAQTLVVLSQTVGQIIGSLLSGVLIDVFGLKTLIVIGGIILLVASGLMIACQRTHASQQQDSSRWYY